MASGAGLCRGCCGGCAQFSNPAWVTALQFSTDADELGSLTQGIFGKTPEAALSCAPASASAEPPSSSSIALPRLEIRSRSSHTRPVWPQSSEIHPMSPQVLSLCCDSATGQELPALLFPASPTPALSLAPLGSEILFLPRQVTPAATS